MSIGARADVVGDRFGARRLRNRFDFFFSFGLAATLTAVGLVFLYGGKIFGDLSLSNNRIVKTLPVLSALVIAGVGAIICYNSLV